MSEMMERLLVLRNVIEQGAEHLPWCGNLAMQKLVYLLEHVFGGDLGYEYGYHHLGPYSFDLAGDLSLGAQAKLWERETHTRMMGSNSFTGNVYMPSEPPFILPETRSTAEDRWREIAPRMEALIEYVKDMTGRQLELIATLHYLRHIQGVDEADLRDVLRALKPKYTDGEYVWGQEQLAKMVGAQHVAA